MDTIPKQSAAQPSPLKISLAEWSLHRTLFGPGLDKRGGQSLGQLLKSNPRSVLQGELDHLDFARIAKQQHAIDAVEYVNVFFYDRARDKQYLNKMKTRADNEGVQSLLIMCDHEGALGDPDQNLRFRAVKNHYQWVEAASILGCHSIRVNARSVGSYDEQLKLVTDGLVQLADYAAQYQINVLVENHGGLSSNGKWLVDVMKRAKHPRLGTLPDFGNFQLSETERYDNYQGVLELMPFARGVSAKSMDFDALGNETHLDYDRLLKLVLDAGYQGHLGIEYEGPRLDEPAGIAATQRLIQRILAQGEC